MASSDKRTNHFDAKVFTLKKAYNQNTMMLIINAIKFIALVFPCIIPFLNKNSNPRVYFRILSSSVYLMFPGEMTEHCS